MMKLQNIIVFFIFLLPSCLMAQRQEIISDHLRTLQVVGADRWLNMPVIYLGTDETVNISFDELSHNYHRYAYTIEHCEADWTPSEGLFESEYLEGIYNGLTIDDVQESINTATLYSHYQFSLPNDQCRIKLSGNYKVTIKDDNTDEVVAHACFMVCEKRFGVTTEVVTNTDVDFNHAHQQLNIRLSFNGMGISNIDRQLKVFSMQNNRWATLRQLPRPQFIARDGLQWSHCRELIFPATNEYHKFEYLDIHRNSMGVDHTGFDGTDYHVWLNTDYPRPAYVYDEDANGAFYIRNTYDYNNDTESEYFTAHFTYSIAEPFDGEVFVNGLWTNGETAADYLMEYDYATKMYHCAVPLKMGYYSYQYLLRRADGTIIYLPSDGNYYETENTYTTLVYYRPTGGRTDLLYGVSELSSRR